MAETEIIKSLESGQNVIYDATNVNTEIRNKFLKMLPECQLKAKVFNVDPEEVKERIVKDINNGVDRANTPPEIVDKMYEQFKESLPKLEGEGFEIID